MNESLKMKCTLIVDTVELSNLSAIGAQAVIRGEVVVNQIGVGPHSPQVRIVVPILPDTAKLLLGAFEKAGLLVLAEKEESA